MKKYLLLFITITMLLCSCSGENSGSSSGSVVTEFSGTNHGKSGTDYSTSLHETDYKGDTYTKDVLVFKEYLSSFLSVCVPIATLTLLGLTLVSRMGVLRHCSVLLLLGLNTRFVKKYFRK